MNYLQEVLILKLNFHNIYWQNFVLCDRYILYPLSICFNICLLAGMFCMETLFSVIVHLTKQRYPSFLNKTFLKVTIIQYLQ